MLIFRMVLASIDFEEKSCRVLFALPSTPSVPPKNIRVFWMVSMVLGATKPKLITRIR